MAKTIATILGAAFILVGLLGFVAPGMMGMHLTLTHNLVHLISGALALYFGLAGTLSGARTFCIVFGAVYALLGVAGYLLGTDQAHTVNVAGHGATDNSLLKVLPGNLELAAPEHGLHILLGLVFLVGGLLTKGDVRAAVRDAT